MWSSAMTLLAAISAFRFLYPVPIHGARILGIFPLAAKSHFTFDEAVMRPLMEAGHQVTLITSFPKYASVHNYTAVIDVSEGETIFMNILPVKANRSTYDLLDSILHAESHYCNKVLQLPQVQAILNWKGKENSLPPFDVVFVEMFAVYKCHWYLIEKLQVPVIGTVPLRIWSYADRLIGNPLNPSYLRYELGNIAGRRAKGGGVSKSLKNVWDSLLGYYFWYTRIVPFLHDFHHENQQQLAEYVNYLEEITPSLVFYNSHASFLPRPLSPMAVEVGGIHMEEIKPLPEEISKFIEESEYGVILFTFGSTLRVDTMSEETRTAFKEAFAEIPQRVIWKFESEMEQLPPNVLLSKWVPQADILAHQKVIAFISHCGIAGVYEAIHSATPIIAIPLFGDQSSNAATLVEELKVAVQLDIDEISKENVLGALKAITKDRNVSAITADAGTNKYYESMQKLSSAFKDRPLTPEQSVVYWTEYVLRQHTRNGHLKNSGASVADAAAKLNSFQYLLLDVIGLIVCSVIIAAYIQYRLLKTCLHYAHLCWRRQTQGRKIK